MSLELLFPPNYSFDVFVCSAGFSSGLAASVAAGAGAGFGFGAGGVNVA